MSQLNQDVEAGKSAPPPYAEPTPEFKSVWDQPSSATTSNKRHHEPKTVHRGWIIFALVCCALFGRLALVYNRQADTFYNTRKNEDGDESAKKARIFTALGIIIGTFVTVVVTAGLIVYIVFRVRSF